MTSTANLRELSQDVLRRDYTTQIASGADDATLQKYRDEIKRRADVAAEAEILSAKRADDEAARAQRRRYDGQFSNLKKLRKTAPAVIELGAEGAALPPAIKATFVKVLSAVNALADLARMIKPRLENYDPHGCDADLHDALMNGIAVLGMLVRFSGDADKADFAQTLRRHVDNIVAEAEAAFRKNWPNGAPPAVPGAS